MKLGKYLSPRLLRNVIFSVSVFVLFGAYFFSTSFASLHSWTLDSGDDFTFDSNLITFADGKAELKQTANWFDANWTRRKAIAIDNTSNSSALSGYQVQVAISYDSDMQADFDDIRFTEGDGTTAVSYYLESKTDSASAVFWVKVPTIAALSTTTIYVYYGNSGASSLSDGNSVFEFFDNFGDSSFNHDKWKYVTFEQGDASLCTETGGALHCSIAAADEASASAIYSIKDELGDDFDAHVDWTSFNSASGNYSSAEFWCDADANNRAWVRIDKNALGQLYYSSNFIQGGVSGSYQFYGPVVQSSGKLRIVRSGGSTITSYRWDGSSYQTLKTVNNFTTENMRCLTSVVSWTDYPDNVNATWDNFVTEGDSAHSDNFDDNSVNKSAWFLKKVGQGEFPSETGQKLYSNAGGAISALSKSSAINRISSVDGDFETSIDFSNFTAPAQNTGYVRIYFWVNDLESVFMSLRKNATNSVYNSVVMMNGSTVNSSTSPATADTSGRLKIRRVGSTVTTYYWSGNDWVQLSSYASFTRDNAEIDIGVMSWDGYPDNVSADIDNVTVRQYSSSNPSTSIGSEQTIYSSQQPSITLSAATIPFTSLTGFSETATKNGGEIKYQLSNDAGTNWYWYNSGWATTTGSYSEASTAAEIDAAIESFPTGSGDFLFRAYLSSDGSQFVQLDEVSINYANAGITVTESGGGTSVTEDGITDSYTIVLDDQPSDTVTVNITPSDTTNGINVSTSTVVFTTGSWNTPVTINITAIDDAAFESTTTATISHSVSSLDSAYNGRSIPDINVSITDNDSFLVSNVSSTETSGTAQFSWTTNALGTTKIAYGLSDSYGMNTTETDTSPRSLSHSKMIENLIPCTSFFYKLISNDGSGNQATSTGTFRTTGCAGNANIEDEVSSDGIVSNATGALIEIGSSTNALSVEIPESYSETCEAYLQIKKLNAESVLGSTGLPEYYDQGLRTYQINALCNPENRLSLFGAPVIVTMTYSDDEISSLDESTLIIQRWDESWNELSNCSINTSSNSVSCETQQFSIFSIFGQTPEEPTPDPEPEPARSWGSSSSGCTKEPPANAPILYGITPQSNSKILLSFKKPSGLVDHYVVLYEKEGEKKERTISDTSSNTYLLDGLSADSRYSIRLRAANGCALGPASRTLSASTYPLIASRALTITSFEIMPEEPANQYQESNPIIPASTTCVDCANPEATTTPRVLPSNYNVKVSVVTEEGKPVAGATVTLHSRTREAKTDINGIAKFVDIEPGAHTLTIAYEDFVGKQTLFLEGDTREISIRITVKQERVVIASAIYGFLAAIIGVGIVALIWKMRKKRKK